MTPLAPHKLAYSVDEAVEATGISKSALYEMMAARNIPWRKQWGRRYFMREDVAALMAAREAHAPQQDPEAEPPPTSGVYLLYADGELTYVGRSSHLRARMSQHRHSGRAFDEARFIGCDQDLANWLEAELIRVLRPPSNVLRYARRAKAAARALGGLA